MKKQFTFLLAFLGTCSLVFSQSTPKLKDPTATVISGVNSGRLNVIDPAVTDIAFTLIKQNSGDKLRITVKIKNLGLKAYESGNNQQNVQLWEEYSSTNRKMVKVFPFQNINGEVSQTFVYERPAFKPSDEFPPNYTAMIVYDPDIKIDNNLNNDDANASNNKLTKNPRQ